MTMKKVYILVPYTFKINAKCFWALCMNIKKSLSLQSTHVFAQMVSTVYHGSN